MRGLLLILAFLGFPWLAGKTETAPSSPARSIAILPIQNDGDLYYTLVESQSEFAWLKDKFREFKGLEPVNPDIKRREILPVHMVIQLTGVLARKGYTVYAGPELLEYFNGLQRMRRDVTYGELQKLTGADTFLLVHIREWDGSEFETEGRIHVSYAVYWIDPAKQGKDSVIWKRESDENIELDRTDFAFHKREGEALREICLNMLKGFPREKRR